MATVNPYRAPTAAVADSAEQYQEVKLFAVSGRIGRVRYIAYSVGVSLLFGILISALSAAFGAAGAGAAVVVVVIAGYIAMFTVMFMLTIQRSHDFDTTGWLSIVVLIPLVNLVFWIIPGTDGENRFGAKTPPNSALAIIGALIVPIIAGVGILAAIALPAYQDYTKRSQQMMQQKK